MHAKYTALMSLALDQEATHAEMATLREHLSQCEACATTWEQWRLLDCRLTEAPLLAPPQDLAQGVAARLAERQRLRHRRRWIGSSFVAAWALVFSGALLLLALLVGWGIRHPVEVSIVLSAAALLLSSLSWLLRGIGALADALGGTVLGLGVAFWAILTLGLGALWIWVATHGQRWARPTVIVGGFEGPS